MAEQPHGIQQTSTGLVGSQSYAYSLETIMKLQKALENGIPGRSLDTDIAEDMGGTTGRESRLGEANSADDGVAFHFAYSWIQRLMYCVREAIRLLLAVAEFQTSAGCSDRTQVTAGSEASGRASVVRSTTEQS